MRSAPKSQTPTFGPLLDASGSELSSAGRIIAVLQTYGAVELWRLISENETKRSNFEQNRSTKSQKAAGVRIVPTPKTLEKGSLSLAQELFEILL